MCSRGRAGSTQHHSVQVEWKTQDHGLFRMPQTNERSANRIPGPGRGGDERLCHVPAKDPHEGSSEPTAPNATRRKGSRPRFPWTTTTTTSRIIHCKASTSMWSARSATKDPTPNPSYSDACSRCHEDHHKGEFTKNGTPDCVECHFLTDGFEVWAFSIEQHKETPSRWRVHQATPCFNVT